MYTTVAVSSIRFFDFTTYDIPSKEKTDFGTLNTLSLYYYYTIEMHKKLRHNSDYYNKTDRYGSIIVTQDSRSLD